MTKVKRLLKFLLVATTVIAVVNAVAGTISLLNAEFTSFPWWSALVFGAYYFGPALALEGMALLAIRIWEKRKNA